MKSKHFRALLQLETDYFSRFLFFPTIFSALFVLFFSLFYQLDLGVFAGVLVVSSALPIFWSYGFFFQDRLFAFNFTTIEGHRRTLEFPYSRAIDRSALFWARTLWFGGGAALPLVGLMLGGFWHPNSTVTIYPTADSPGVALRAFYLANFPGAVLRRVYVAPSLLGDSILLPHARIELAAAYSWIGLTAAALYQALMLGTLRSRWIQSALPLLFSIGPGVLLFLAAIQVDRRNLRNLGVSQPPALYQTLAWAIQHPLVLFLTGAMIIGIALRFGCRKFIHQEVLP